MNLSKIDKLLIIRLSSLGDILLSTPLLRSIKEKYPQIKIDYLVKKKYRDSLLQNAYINKLYIYTDNKDDLIELSENFKKNKYDLILDLQNNLRSKKIVYGIKSRILKFDKKNLEKFLLVKFKINRLKNVQPIPIRYAEIVDNFQLDNKGLDLFSNKTASDAFTSETNYIGFCPGARHFTKMWPKEYYIELGNLLSKDHYRIAIFGGKEDADICREISSRVQNSLNLCNNDDILQTAADMKICKAVVCNDSGLMHAACALQLPVVTLFGSTVKEFGFIPYKNKNVVLENNSLSCRPCTHIGRSFCPKGHFKCMLDITPELAFNNLKSLLRP